MFYDQQWAANWWYQILLVMSSQILGYGLAGMSRKFLVYPGEYDALRDVLVLISKATAVWPGVLPVIALNKSFHDHSNEPANGIRLSCNPMFITD